MIPFSVQRVPFLKRSMNERGFWYGGIQSEKPLSSSLPSPG